MISPSRPRVPILNVLCLFLLAGLVLKYGGCKDWGLEFTYVLRREVESCMKESESGVVERVKI